MGLCVGLRVFAVVDRCLTGSAQMDGDLETTDIVFCKSLLCNIRSRYPWWIFPVWTADLATLLLPLRFPMPKHASEVRARTCRKIRSSGPASSDLAPCANAIAFHAKHRPKVPVAASREELNPFDTSVGLALIKNQYSGGL